MNDNYTSKEWLQHQYEVLGSSIGKIAESCGTTHQTINRWIKKFGIEKRDPRTQQAMAQQRLKEKHDATVLHNKEGWLYQKHIVEEMSIAHMAEEGNCSVATIKKWLKEYGIKDREEKILKPDYTNMPYKNREWLYDKYVVHNMSITEMAKRSASSPKTISRWLDKHEIKMRTPKEAALSSKQVKAKRELTQIKNKYFNEARKNGKPILEWITEEENEHETINHYDV